MKKIFLILLLVLSLTSCFNSNNSKNQVAKELVNPNQNSSVDVYKTARLDFDKDLNTIIKK